MKPPIHSVSMKVRYFSDQLGEFDSPHSPDRPDIHMPESFRFTNQSCPGSHLLPLTQTYTGRTSLMVEEKCHDSSLTTEFEEA